MKRPLKASVIIGRKDPEVRLSGTRCDPLDAEAGSYGRRVITVASARAGRTTPR